MKKLILTLLAALLIAPAALAQPTPTTKSTPTTQPAPAVPAAVRASALWPHKADWVGRQATIFPARLYATASYLLLYPQPGQELSGVDQLALGRRLAGRTFTIQGLYELKKAKAISEYYWLLTSPQEKVWVRDTRESQTAALPFALDSEIAADAKKISELSALADATVWIDRNRTRPGDLSAPVGHLAPLTVVAFKSAGPFSDIYTLTLQQEDGTPLVWTVKTTGSGATAYSNGQFAALFAKNFYRQEPRTLFPRWAEHLWPLIAAREIRVGWDKEMVLMSWGDPDKKTEKIEEGPNKGLEKWQYPGSHHLYFRDKLLVKIKLPDPAFKPDPASKAPAKPGASDKPTAKQGKSPRDPKNTEPEGLIEVTGAIKKDDKT